MSLAAIDCVRRCLIRPKSKAFLNAIAVPESKGGPMVLDNLQTLCRSCNSRKKDRL